jgi:hypothetical protein
MDVRSVRVAFRGVRRRVGALARSRAGAMSVMMAVAAPVVIGAAGLGTEAAFWQARQRGLQQQADLAAFAGGVELMSGGNAGSIDATARQSLERGGFRAEIGAATVETPPQSGPYAGGRAVVVSVEEVYPRLISGLFLDSDPVLRASATALVEESGQACVLALETNASSAVAFGGSTSVRLNGCSLMSNSSAADSMVLGGSATLEASCVGAAGGVTAGSGMRLSDCDAPRTGLARMSDPYADIAEPAVVGPCKTPNNFGGPSGATHSITPGRFCGLTMSRTVNMAPGTYVIDGGELRIGSTAVVTGHGVTIHLTNGAHVVINGGATIDLSAPTSGPYAGLLFFGRRSGASVDHVLNGSAASRFTGAIYMPNDRLEMRGSNTAGAGCTQIVARTIDFRGNSGMGMDCAGTGVRDLRMVSGVRLVL